MSGAGTKWHILVNNNTSSGKLLNIDLFLYNSCKRDTTSTSTPCLIKVLVNLTVEWSIEAGFVVEQNYRMSPCLLSPVVKAHVFD
jgi:hypothetical protein